MQTHQLPKPNRKKHKRIGRGGKRGSFSGRGIKGQKSRAGRRIRPQVRDVIKKIHKRRGYKFNSYREKPLVVNIGDIDSKFDGGDRVTADSLSEAKLIRIKKGRRPKIKILGEGKLSKKLTFSDEFLFSGSAKNKLNNTA